MTKVTKVKVCGLTRQEDVRAAVEAGADYLGFVFARSDRAVSPETARALIDGARQQGFDGDAVGVFVDATADAIHDVVDRAGVTLIQLHGDEPEDVLTTAADRTPVWRAIRVPANWSPERVTEAGLLVNVAADAVLLDRHVPGVVGGTGRSFDPAWARELASKRPVVLAGGLTAETVGEAIRQAHPMAVDVSSGVETAPGLKDAPRIRAFIASVRAADRELDRG